MRKPTNWKAAIMWRNKYKSNALHFGKLVEVELGYVMNGPGLIKHCAKCIIYNQCNCNSSDKHAVVNSEASVGTMQRTKAIVQHSGQTEIIRICISFAVAVQSGHFHRTYLLCYRSWKFDANFHSKGIFQSNSEQTNKVRANNVIRLSLMCENVPGYRRFQLRYSPRIRVCI